MADDQPADPHAAYSRGCAAHEAGDWHTALSVFREFASEGHGPSEFMLGTMYHWGEGVGRDLAEALALYLYV